MVKWMTNAIAATLVSHGPKHFFRPVTQGLQGVAFPGDDRRVFNPSGTDSIETAGGYPAGDIHVGQVVSRFFDINFTGNIAVDVALENFTGSTDLHLFLPVALIGAVTDGAADEPAVLAGIEFPGRAF